MFTKSSPDTFCLALYIMVVEDYHNGWKEYIFNGEKVNENNFTYCNLPIKGASPNKGASYSFEEASLIITDQNQHNFLNNYLFFNPKPPLESWEAKLCLHTIKEQWVSAHISGFNIGAAIEYAHSILKPIYMWWYD